VSKLSTDVVTYCTEASNQKSKYAYRKILFYKKALIETYNLCVFKNLLYRLQKPTQLTLHRILNHEDEGIKSHFIDLLQTTDRRQTDGRTTTYYSERPLKTYCTETSPV